MMKKDLFTKQLVNVDKYRYRYRYSCDIISCCRIYAGMVVNLELFVNVYKYRYGVLMPIHKGENEE
jgi:hypothetical protein